LKQIESADYIGLNKFAWVVDGAIDVALGGEVHDGVWLSAAGSH
jgi:hypothetical protein